MRLPVLLLASALLALPAAAQHQHAPPIGLTGKVDLWATAIGERPDVPSSGVPLEARMRYYADPDAGPSPWAAPAVRRRGPSTFVLSSNGGDAAYGRIAGRRMMDGGHTAIVRNGQNCASACVLVLLGGRPAVVTRGAAVILHGLSDGPADSRAWEIGALRRYLHRALAPLDPERTAFVERWLAMPPDAESKMTEAELRAIGVRIIDPPEL